MARDKIHLLRWASADRIDLFRGVFTRRKDGSIEIRGGAHCERRPCGLDHYQPHEVWVIEPDRLDAIKSFTGEVERAISQAVAAQVAHLAPNMVEFAHARARDAVSQGMVNELTMLLKGCLRLDQWIIQRGGLPE